ncbi:sugar phosphate isomerase/epimerase family protein [Xanthobacter autotrophicus DSM 431]|uniref:sugar phosphate isomerase/epimerase family protein n=1 Tax=Xanthobacter nonsaccharivorans TaxID=3119912 RepID=UPI0037274332
MAETTPPGTDIFGVNTYSYTFDWGAADCVRHLSDQGYRGIELMMYPGHLWPGGTGTASATEVRRALDATGLPVVSVNMPNIDINIAAASDEMRAYSLELLTRFVEVAGEVGAPAIIVGPGKANPLFAPARDLLLGHFRAALDRLGPAAEKAGTRILVENMPFAFLPRAQEIMAALDDYGNDDIGVIYDVANGHFIGEDPCEGLRTVKDRLGLVHFSDTGRTIYRHDPVGLGDVPFSSVPPVLEEIGYRQMPVLEVISRNADADTRDSAERLAALGYV